MANHPMFLPGEFHEQRNLEGYSPWGHKESDMAEQLRLSLCTQTRFEPVEEPTV